MNTQENRKEFENRLVCEEKESWTSAAALVEIAWQLEILNRFLAKPRQQRESSMEYADRLMDEKTQHPGASKQDAITLAKTMADHVASRQHEPATTGQLDALQKIADSE